jgi:hypothetical protein
MPREIGIFNQIKPFQPYLKHLIYNKFLAWFDRMLSDFEDPVVTCGGCGVQFRNNPNARLFVEDQKFYACSGDCKAKIGSRVRKEKKEN